METAQKMENRMLTPEIKRNLEIIIVRMKGKKVTDKKTLSDAVYALIVWAWKNKLLEDKK